MIPRTTPSVSSMWWPSRTCDIVTMEASIV
jgi:hypothetical protein